MPTKWRIIDCTSLEGSLHSIRGAVEIHKESEVFQVPVADVGTVLIGPKVVFSAAAMHRLLAADIAVIFCDWKGVPEGTAMSWSEHGRVGARHRAQAHASLPRQKNAWGRIIRAKVKGQAQVLRLKGKLGASEIESLSREVRSGDPGNVEARAARVYWKELWGDEGFHRIPGSPDTTQHSRNAQLDYAYTVLRGHGIRAVVGAGLSPTIGLFHHGRSNNFALVDDLIEPFRPAVDFGVARLPSDADMEDPAIRKQLVAAASSTFGSDGKTISSVLEEFAQHFGQYIEVERDSLPVPTWIDAK